MTDHRKQVRTSRRWKIGRIAVAAGAVVMTSAFLEVPARASPQSGISVTVPALANYGQIDVSPSNSTGKWHFQAKTNQDTDVAVIDAVIAPGGYFGWHTHPGASFVTIIRGELTEYNSDGCVVTTYHAGDHFYEPANHVHDVRSSGGAEVIAVAILPHGAPPEDNSPPAPSGCP
jgi:quercetin dioxygenase-like cupin family protein